MHKAAIVIGVNKTGNLGTLKSAAAGAERIASWLRAEGFDVESLTDEKGSPVECSAVEKAIEKFVTVPARYQLLVVYFSGHGHWQARSDVWLLSGAPVKPNEAINLEAAMDLAKYSGIPNVVFISDACRSIPNSRAGAKVEGRGVFPNYDDVIQPSKIDFFKATTESLPAYEVTLDGKPCSTLTAALSSAYENPEQSMVRTVTEGTESFEVVPNRRLEDYLQRKVDEILAKVDPSLTQRIEINVPSSDDVYLARVRRLTVTAPAPPLSPPEAAGPRERSLGPPPSPAASGKEAAAAIERSATNTAFGLGSDLKLMDVGKMAERQVRNRLPDRQYEHFETQMGFILWGSSVRRAIAAPKLPNVVVDILDAGEKKTPAVIRVDSQQPLSIVVEVADGRCIILAGLPGYIGHATFDVEGLSNVSYVPSANHWRWSEYIQRRDEIDRLRALVALAVDRNMFRVSSREAADQLASRIRILKSIDPTLGLYAAYAFSQSGNDAQILSVLDYMRGDLNAEFFDIRLLASRYVSARESTAPVVPLCPMLTQSWHLLRARRAALPLVFKDVIPSLSGSLWTTFEPDAAKEILEAAVKEKLP
jgi:hypothetical protein